MPHTDSLSAAFLWISLGLLACQPQATTNGAVPRILIDGSTTLNPMLVAAAQQLEAEHAAYRVEARQSSSGDGIKKLLAAEVDMAAVSRGPSDAEYAKAAKAGRELYLSNIAFDGLVVIVHPQNPVAGFSLEQIRDVFFGGGLRDWAALTEGRKTGAIHVYAAPASQSGLTDFLANRLTGNSKTPLVAGATGFDSDLELIERVAADPDGISIAGVGRARAAATRVKVTLTEGVVPTEQTVLRTEYPFSRRVYLLTNGRPRGVQRDFIIYLMSRPGQLLARQVGLVPTALEDLQ